MAICLKRGIDSDFALAKTRALVASSSSSLSNIQWRDENENNASLNTFYLDILRHFQTVFTNTFHSRHTLIVSEPNSPNVLMEFSCCESCLKLQISRTVIWCITRHISCPISGIFMFLPIPSSAGHQYEASQSANKWFHWKTNVNEDCWCFSQAAIVKPEKVVAQCRGRKSRWLTKPELAIYGIIKSFTHKK